MRSRMLPRLFVLLGGLLLLCSAPARAEDPAALLTRGNQLFNAGDYEKAYEAFKEGQAQKPSEVFQRSLAFCAVKLSRHAEALTLIEDYLKKYPKAKDAPKLQELVGNLKVIVKTTLTVASTPAGAEVYIDAEAAGKRGVTPTQTPLTVEPGRHLLILKSPGYHPTVKMVNIEAEKAHQESLVLEVPLDVKSDPPGATIHVDSPTAPSKGKAPLLIGVVPGKRTIYLKVDGYKTLKLEVTAAPKTTASLAGTLELGIAVASQPRGAQVEIDGKPVEGTTPLEVAVAKGSHSVLVRHTCGSATEKVEVGPGQPNRVEVRIAGCGLLSMRTDIQGASVMIADKQIGTTPLEDVAVPSGRQTISVTHPDRRPWSDALDFSDTEVVTADVKLGRPSWPAWVAGAVGVAGVVLGTVGGVMAKQRYDDYEFLKRDTGDICIEKGSAASGGKEVDSSNCSYAYHHMSTVGLVTGGVAAAAGVLYYLLWVRPKVEVTRKPVGETRAARRPLPAF